MFSIAGQDGFGLKTEFKLLGVTVLITAIVIVSLSLVDADKYDSLVKSWVSRIW